MLAQFADHTKFLLARILSTRETAPIHAAVTVYFAPMLPLHLDVQTRQYCLNKGPLYRRQSQVRHLWRNKKKLELYV
jgi:hypothetical protein